MNLCKTHQHGLFIGLCLTLTAGIGYNIGRISAMHSSVEVGTVAEVGAGVSKTPNSAPQIKITQPSPILTDPRVVASKAAGSKLYHYSWCSGAKRIKETNKLWFSTEEEAISAGYTLAGNCQ